MEYLVLKDLVIFNCNCSLEEASAITKVSYSSLSSFIDAIYPISWKTHNSVCIISC